MKRETLLQVKTKQLTLELRGAPMPEAGGVPCVICEDAVTVGDGAVSRVIRQRLQLVVQASQAVRVTPLPTDVVQNEDGTFLTGYLNLEMTVGPVDLCVLLAGEGYLRLTLEVCPDRHAYQEDHTAMEAELQQVLHRVAYTAMRREDPDFLPDGYEPSKIRAAMEGSCHCLLETADAVLNGLQEKPALRLLKRRTAYDTPENRLTKYVLRAAARCLRMAEAPDELIGACNNRAAREELAQVGTYNSAEETRPDAMAPEYQVLYQHYRHIACCAALLQLRVSLPLEQLPQLYRYWALGQMAALLLDRYPMMNQTMLTLSRNGIALPFLSGRSAWIDFDALEAGRTVRLSFESDGLIYLQKSGEVPCVFDACYQENLDLTESCHRRNALYYQYRSGAPGSFVLFPGADTPDYRESDAYRSIAREQVGGVPLLPGKTQLLERLLDKLLCGIPMLDFEPAVLPTALEMELEQVDWSRHNVLVGAMRNPEQLELCLKRRFYHIPAHLVDQSVHPIGYVALYQSRNLFGRDAGIWHYGEVAEYNAVPRYTIKELPSYSKETYYRFAIKQWHKLPKGIQVRDAGSIAKMTNLFLLQNSTTDTELLIADERMFRLQYALRQALDGYGAGDGETETGFALAGCQVAVYQGKILVFREKTLCGTADLAAWRKRPRQTLDQLYQCIFPKEDEK